MIPPSVRTVLESAALAHVATIDADGSPHVTLAWVGVEDDQVVMATLFDQRKLKNLRRDPRLTISIETPKVNDWGLHEYVVIYGRASVIEGGAPELLQRLARSYLGPDVVFPALPDPPPGFVTRISVDRVAGVGPWTAEAT